MTLKSLLVVDNVDLQIIQVLHKIDKNSTYMFQASKNEKKHISLFFAKKLIKTRYAVLQRWRCNSRT
jgi:hypothetical protein